MKKIILFLLVALFLGSQSVLGQRLTDNPILPRIYEDGYTIDQIKSFTKKDSELSRNYRTKLLFKVNRGLKRSGENLNVNNGNPLNEDHIDWIFEQIERCDKDSLPAGHENTWKNGYQISDCISEKPYYGPIDRFVFGSCLIRLIKPSCVNLLGEVSTINFQQPQTLLQVTPPTTSTKTDENLDVDFGSNNNKSTTTTKTTSQPKVNPSVLAIGKTKKSRADRTYVGRNLGWIIPVGAGVLGTAAGFVFPSEGYLWYHLFPNGGTDPHGSMSGGREFTKQDGTTTTQPGGGRGD